MDGIFHRTRTGCPWRDLPDRFGNWKTVYNRPLARITSAGQRHDSLAFGPLMGQLAIARPGGGRARTRPGRVRGDRAYSSAAIRAHLRRRGIKATIPEPSDQARHRQQRGRDGGRPTRLRPHRLQGPQHRRTRL